MTTNAGPGKKIIAAPTQSTLTPTIAITMLRTILYGVFSKRRKVREMRCSFSPQGREKAFVDEFLYQTVVVKLFGLRLLRLGIFPAALFQSDLNGFAFDQGDFFNKVVSVLHGSLEHGRICDLGVAGNNRLRLLFAGMHEMNCFSISAYEGLDLSPALAHELTRGRQALMQKRDLLLGEIRQHLHPALLSHQPHGIGQRR